ncbi:predicted protein [Verticillium alfalfae VaMs.102]|uniref:Predicted protein n=1 Tax=Verticillium alfalfae (strain VaMs.102 / ATCC MYA-4576 / FGSC 10136) TaxID=526221 RepID=C9SKL3_VERA1|nr:predicted protein [Verticillium alfalfae VaMs.102]EEY19231.1 predicted protein [Verticillium alfalfae VaMs.102]
MAEPIGLGASVLAFVTLTLKSAKTIHDVLSAVKEAPDSVRRLTSEVIFMQSILRRLSNFTNLQIQTIPVSDAEALENVLKVCFDDISHISERLQDFVVFPKTNNCQRALKWVRAAYNETDMVRLTNMLRGHAYKLQLYLTIMQNETAAAESASRMAEAAVQAMRGDQHTASLTQIIGLLTDMHPLTTCADQSEIVERLARLAMEDTRTVEVDDYESIVADVQVSEGQLGREDAAARG